MVKFIVEGTARPQGSKRHVGNGIMIESSKYVGDWRSWVRLKASQAMAGKPLLTGPLFLSASFGFKRPKKHYTSKGILRPDAPFFHTAKPDVDKVLRAILDAMTGVVFKDDSYVAVEHCLKKYQEDASTEIEVVCCGGRLKL